MKYHNSILDLNLFDYELAPLSWISCNKSTPLVVENSRYLIITNENTVVELGVML